MQINDYRRVYDAVAAACASMETIPARALHAGKTLADDFELAQVAVTHIFEGTTPPRVVSVQDGLDVILFDYDSGDGLEGSTIHLDFEEFKATYGDLFQPFEVHEGSGGWGITMFVRPGVNENPWPERLHVASLHPEHPVSMVTKAKAPKQPLRLELIKCVDNVLELRDQNSKAYGQFYHPAASDYDLYRAVVSATEAFETTINNPAPEDTTLFTSGLTRRQAWERQEELGEPLPEREYELVYQVAGFTQRRTVRLQDPSQVQIPDGVTRYRLEPKVEYAYGQYVYAGTNEPCRADPAEWVDVAA
jgi:hypothetical protein